MMDLSHKYFPVHRFSTALSTSSLSGPELVWVQGESSRDLVSIGDNRKYIEKGVRIVGGGAQLCSPIIYSWSIMR